MSKTINELTNSEILSVMEKLIEEMKQRREEKAVTKDKQIQPTQFLQTRHEIVERAKELVENIPNHPIYLNNKYNPRTDNVHFIVNSKKRVVVTIVKRNGKAHLKGVAKCNPTDCFNAHIGKFIALKRAFGHKIDEKFTNIPEPTTFNIGDIITFKVDEAKYKTYYKIESLESKLGNLTIVDSDVESLIGKPANSTDFKQWAKVIDDSRC